MSRQWRGMIILAAVVVLATVFQGVVAAEEKPVLLRWKVPAGKTLGFRTDISPADPAKEKGVKLDLEGLFEEDLEEGETGGKFKELAKEMENLSEAKMPAHVSATILLKRVSDKRISVKMVMGKVEMPEPEGDEPEADPAGKMREMREMAKKMEGTVQLRGEIDDSGSITSFYLQQPQKNLIALFFELPAKAVKPGDTWFINVNLISMGHGFICEGLTYTNHVKLVSLKKNPDGDTIAVIDYFLLERIKGKFKMPAMGMMRAGGVKPITMDAAFVARGEFLVNAGCWKRVSGRMRIKATGMMSVDTNQNMMMEPMEEVPAALLKLE